MAEENNQVTFRDRISTQSAEGRKIKVYTNPPKGKLHTYRLFVAIALLAFFFGAPLIKINGDPIMLFNVTHRKFILFGKIFWPQDFHLLVIAMITFLVALVLFTVIYGRVWCGWACPQTIFLEMVYRKIEYLIDGNRKNQIRLAQSDWTFEKVWKRTVKHLLFVILSLLIANTLLSYFVSADKVIGLVKAGPGANFGLFVLTLLIAFVFYFLYTIFREQVCSILCPYGRLQGVLLDSNSIVVAYDYMRGEPRGKLTKAVGNCIDCKKCVQVCPTQIDIRNGTQLECINCTACIDACNSVMTRMKKPKGLIRFASENEIKNELPFKFNTRIIAYTVALFILLAVLVGLFITNKKTETTILRTSGSLYQVQPNGDITNLYTVKVINKTGKDQAFELKLLEPEGTVQLVGKKDTLYRNNVIEEVLILNLPKDQLITGSNQVTFGIYINGEMTEKVKTSFLAP